MCRIALVLCLLAFAPAASAIAQLDSPWAWGPTLGAFGETFVTVTWSVTRPVEIEVHYGREEVYLEEGTWEETLFFPRHQGQALIPLDDLEPGTAYRYQLIVYEGDASHPGPMGRFTTLGREDDGFRFLVYGNTGGFPERHGLVVNAMMSSSENSRCVINLGPPIRSTAPEEVAAFFSVIDPLALSQPYLAVAGAPERADEERTFYDMFALPAGGGTSGEQWWSLDIGAVHLVAMDVSTPEGPEAAALITQQVAWLEQDLTGSSAPIKILLLREPIYSSLYPGGVDEGLRLRWEAILRDGGVDLVLAGGLGRYEHIFMRGIHHVVTSGGGGVLADAAQERAPGTVFSRYGTLHYLYVTVDAEGAVRVEAIPVGVVYDVGLDEEGQPIEEVHLVLGGVPMEAFTIRP
jgi:hypothetical protein